MSQPTSTIDSHRIQAVVREVIARLQNPSAGTSAAAPAAKASNHSVISIAETLVTCDSFRSLPAGVQEIVVRPGTVVTPAAFDLLKERGLRLTRAETSPDAAIAIDSVIDPTGRLFSDADDSLRADSVQKQLAASGLKVANIGLPVLFQHLDKHPLQRAVVLAELPAKVVYQACQHRRICAAAVRSLAELQRIERGLQPNLWVIDMNQVTLPLAVFLAGRCLRMQAPDSLPSPGDVR
ncbi:hypothetical protein FF011L_15520 [Roseimaritima multifibrata]|uniref:Uncharacterized protein n=1 Tax=Roseimaritima multifibrata TaxID=1930274 RepID=A0A517MD30_9BACT|nr:hypothetical protein [Roseimaritima multifibrata]QDS92803.1 hypothetical protein FF011L_15520 [Roseimaritima multifibrata]